MLFLIIKMIDQENQFFYFIKGIKKIPSLKKLFKPQERIFANLAKSELISF